MTLDPPVFSHSPYNISLQRTFDPPEAKTLEYNSTISAEITNLAEMDAYTLNVNEGDIISITMTASLISFDPRI